MTRISNTEHVLLLLHEQLGRMAKDRMARGPASSSERTTTPEPVARLRALAGRHDVSDEDLKRALIRGVLTQQLGEAIAGDAAFEAVAMDVLRIIIDTPEGRGIIDAAAAQLNLSAS